MEHKENNARISNLEIRFTLRGSSGQEQSIQAAYTDSEYTAMTCNGDDKDWSAKWKSCFLHELTSRPKQMTEVRRDGKDDAVLAKVISAELDRRLGVEGDKKKVKFEAGMRDYAAACWQTCESLHMLMLEDEQPENEKQKMDPDHWFEINLTNALLFANLSLQGLPQLVPGRLFSTRMPRDIVENEVERKDFIEKCRKNDLRVICVLTEEEEFEKYSGDGGLLDFYRDECGLTVYNRSIPDFQIPTHGDLVNNIIDLTYHLSQGRNCLVHCAGGTGRTGMVIAAVVKNLGFYDPIARIRRVKSTYVETRDQEVFLENLPIAIDTRILRNSPMLAKAIAAEHLIQVFHTHGGSVESSEIACDVVEVVGQDSSEVESKIRKAYGQTFDLLDSDKSGTLERDELMEWFDMCGAELDLTKIVDNLTKEGTLTRDKFTSMMATFATAHRRDYAMSGTLKSSH